MKWQGSSGSSSGSLHKYRLNICLLKHLQCHWNFCSGNVRIMNSIILDSNYHNSVLTELEKRNHNYDSSRKNSDIWTTFKSLSWFSPMNNWLLSCKWMCPSVGACCVAAGYLSTRSEASLMFRSACTLCHRLSFRGTFVSTLTSRGPFPTSKEKTTSEEAKEEQQNSCNSDKSERTC